MISTLAANLRNSCSISQSGRTDFGENHVTDLPCGGCSFIVRSFITFGGLRRRSNERTRRKSDSEPESNAYPDADTNSNSHPDATTAVIDSGADAGTGTNARDGQHSGHNCGESHHLSGGGESRLPALFRQAQ
jgi:hypothetical protein